MPVLIFCVTMSEYSYRGRDAKESNDDELRILKKKMLQHQNLLVFCKRWDCNFLFALDS